MSRSWKDINRRDLEAGERRQAARSLAAFAQQLDREQAWGDWLDAHGVECEECGRLIQRGVDCFECWREGL